MPPSVIYVLQCSPAAFKYIIVKIYHHFQQLPIGSKVLCEKLGITVISVTSGNSLSLINFATRHIYLFFSL